MLTLELTACDGSRCRLPMLISWELTFTGSVPCDSLSATCLYDGSMADFLPKATRFTALRDGEVMLHGVVDSYGITLSEKGLLATVEGRGMAALLLDNESEAVTYGRASSADLLCRHAEPYGIRSEIRRNVSGLDYTVVSGSSQWKALQSFTHRFGGFEPYFTREGVLILAPLWGSGKTLRLDDDSPILALEKREQRYGVISEMLIQDKVQGISHRVPNEEFISRGGCRRHVLYMPRSTADERRYTGDYQIGQSALEQLEITVTLPMSFAAFPGDRAALQLKRLALQGEYDVVETRCRMDAGGECTELVLSVRS